MQQLGDLAAVENVLVRQWGMGGYGYGNGAHRPLGREIGCSGLMTSVHPKWPTNSRPCLTTSLSSTRAVDPTEPSRTSQPSPPHWFQRADGPPERPHVASLRPRHRPDARVCVRCASAVQFVGALAALAFGPDLEMPCRASCSAHGVYDLHGLKPANDINQYRAHDASKHHATQPPKRPEADRRYAENGG
jgi:hypothetical protein